MGHGERVEDPFNLERFVEEQDRAGIYEQAVKELRSGRKRTHWMWFVFPQLQGLGATETAWKSSDEARAYLEHEVLGPRLRECAQLVARSGVKEPSILMGSQVDQVKLKSSMTLFAAVAEDNEDFLAVLRRYFHGGKDLKTLQILRAEQVTSRVDPPTTKPARRRWLRGRLQ